MLARAATALLSPGGRRSRLTVFIFHRVLAVPDPMLPSEPDAAEFDRMLGWITAQFRVLPLVDAAHALSAGSLPARAAAITFDDGYRDNHDVALPILVRRRVPATVFVATGFLDGGVMFNDRVIEVLRRCPRSIDCPELALGTLPLGSIAERIRAVDRVLGKLKYLPPDDRIRAVEALESRCADRADLSRTMLDSEGVRRLESAGVEIGAHTRHHPILQSVDDASARREIESGREDLRSLLRAPPRAFAYPNGRPGVDFGIRHARMAREAGFDLAVTTAAGAASERTDPFLIPRFTPWDRSALRFQWRAWSNLRIESTPCPEPTAR